MDASSRASVIMAYTSFATFVWNELAPPPAGLLSRETAVRAIVISTAVPAASRVVMQGIFDVDPVSGVVLSTMCSRPPSLEFVVVIMGIFCALDACMFPGRTSRGEQAVEQTRAGDGRRGRSRAEATMPLAFLARAAAYAISFLLVGWMHVSDRWWLFGWFDICFIAAEIVERMWMRPAVLAEHAVCSPGRVRDMVARTVRIMCATVFAWTFATGTVGVFAILISFSGTWTLALGPVFKIAFWSVIAVTGCLRVMWKSRIIGRLIVSG